MHGTPLLSPVPNIAASLSLRTKAMNQLGIQKQVNRSAKKRRKLVAGDETIASAIKDFSKGILEVEKMKLGLSKKIIKNEREEREMMLRAEKESREMMM